MATHVIIQLSEATGGLESSETEATCHIRGSSDTSGSDTLVRDLGGQTTKCSKKQKLSIQNLVSEKTVPQERGGNRRSQINKGRVSL